jgi:hypothetical protein
MIQCRSPLLISLSKAISNNLHTIILHEQPLDGKLLDCFEQIIILNPEHGVKAAIMLEGKERSLPEASLFPRKRSSLGVRLNRRIQFGSSIANAIGILQCGDCIETLKFDSEHATPMLQSHDRTRW